MRGSPRPPLEHIFTFRRDVKALGAVKAIFATVTYPICFARLNCVSFPGNARTTGNKIQTGIYCCLNVSELIPFVRSIITVVEGIKQRQSIGICLIRVYQILTGQEESVATVRTFGGIEQVAPIYISGTFGFIIHRILYGKHRLYPIFIFQLVELLKVIQKIIRLPLRTYFITKSRYFSKQLFVDSNDLIILILLVSLIKFGFGSVCVCYVLGDTAYLGLSVRQVVSGVKKLLRNLAKKFFAGKLIVGDVFIIINIHVFVKVRYLFEKANQFEEEMCTNHFHFSFTALKYRQGVLIKCIHDSQCTVATLQATIKLKPFFIGISPCSIYLKSFKQCTKVTIVYTTATFIGIVRTYFTIRPIGHRYPVHITIGTFQPGVSRSDQEFHTFSRRQQIVIECTLRFSIKKTTLITTGQ